ncbi:hypothetical protein KBC86_02440 [Candidatus Gracilibacteria bacterium]|nr:hypothetical protein [Candidatus Gracilibacteria bacterium]
MENQFERTFAGIFLNTDSLIAKIDSLSRGYEDYYGESLTYSQSTELFVNNPEQPGKMVDVTRLVTVFLGLGIVMFLILLPLMVEDEPGIFVDQYYAILFLVMLSSPIIFWFLRRRFIKMRKSNTDLNFFLVSQTIFDLEDLYKNFFLQHMSSSSEYLTYTQELVNFFRASRTYFEEIEQRLTNLPSTTEINSAILQGVQREAIDWFIQLLALNITFLSDWINKTEIELEQLRTHAKKHASSEESKESALGKFLLVSLEEEKKYFLGVKEQLPVRVR